MFIVVIDVVIRQGAAGEVKARDARAKGCAWQQSFFLHIFSKPWLSFLFRFIILLLLLHTHLVYIGRHIIIGYYTTGISYFVKRQYMDNFLSSVIYWWHRIFLQPFGLTSHVKLHYNAEKQEHVNGVSLLDILKTKCPSLVGPRAWYTPSWWLFGSGNLQVGSTV